MYGNTLVKRKVLQAKDRRQGTEEGDRGQGTGHNMSHLQLASQLDDKFVNTTCFILK